VVDDGGAHARPWVVALDGHLAVLSMPIVGLPDPHRTLDTIWDRATNVEMQTQLPRRHRRDAVTVRVLRPRGGPGGDRRAQTVGGAQWPSEPRPASRPSANSRNCRGGGRLSRGRRAPASGG